MIVVQLYIRYVSTDVDKIHMVPSEDENERIVD